jgi:FkbM family methyltransferase
MVREFVIPGDRVLELGASTGVISTLLLKRVGKSGRVVSVEGNPLLEPWFNAQLAANGFVGEWFRALCHPVWHSELPSGIEKKGFHVSSNPLGSAAAASGSSLKEENWMTASAICKAVDLSPNVLIIDIEGSEECWAEALPAVPDTVERAIIEFHPRLIGERLTGKCIQSILEDGFRIVALKESVIAFSR